MALYVREKKPITRGLGKKSYVNQITQTPLKSQMVDPYLFFFFFNVSKRTVIRPTCAHPSNQY